jgi:hypothetical protein
VGLRIAALLSVLWVLPELAWAGPESAGTPEHIASLFIAGVLAVAAFIITGAWVGRRQDVPEGPQTAGPCVGNAPWPAGVPLVSGRQAWRMADADSRSQSAAELAVRLAQERPVLFLPAPEHRAEALKRVGTAPGVRWLEPVRPDASAVHAGLNTLDRQGSSILVIDGAGAIADPQALQGLFEDLRAPAILLLAGDKPAPTGLCVTEVSATAFEAPSD